MNLSTNTQATLLLTSHFAKPTKGAARPLTITEWSKLAAWLRDKDLTPAALLQGDLETKLGQWNDTKITLSRMTELLARGTAMAMALEKWSRAGIWVISRSDSAYPARLKKQLKAHCPPILFGCGNSSLLNAGGIAVVGSRNLSEADAVFSAALGQKCANSGLSIVSGGARGVDETAMLGSLEAGGTAVGIMADSLLRASCSKKYRDHLMANNLVLVSPFYPEAGFNAGNAMQRNKYIYTLSDAAVVVHSGLKGGTWTGATENIKKQWVPLWVKENTAPDAGNSQLVTRGGHTLPSTVDSFSIQQLITDKPVAPKEETESLFSQKVPQSEQAEDLQRNETPTPTTEDAPIPEKKSPKSASHGQKDQPPALQLRSLAQALILESCQSPKTAKELLTSLEVEKKQLDAWVKPLVDDGLLTITKKRPITYLSGSANNSTQSSFL